STKCSAGSDLHRPGPRRWRSPRTRPRDDRAARRRDLAGDIVASWLPGGRDTVDRPGFALALQAVAVAGGTDVDQVFGAANGPAALPGWLSIANDVRRRPARG